MPAFKSCLILLSVTLVFAFQSIALGEQTRPNVVMLLSDDLGWQDIGVYNGPVKTPTLDGLAEQGTRFTNFYSGCAVCSPSRATLLTGRNHIRTGIYSWVYDQTQNSHLLEREITLAEVLKKEGYSTAHVGKWHLGISMGERKKPSPGDHGFDHWFATANNALPSHKNPNNFLRNGEAMGEMEGYSAQIVADEAIDWLENHRDKESPFFLNIWFHEPHQRIAAPDHIVSQYGDLKDRGAIYSGTIHNTDLATKRLLAKVREIDLPENTIIIYASDNGSYLDDRTGGLRGRKGMNWEGGIRVPGIFVWPGKINASVEDSPAGLVDVLPTVCSLLGLDKPATHLDGSDLSPILLGKPKQFERHQPLFWHLQKARPVVAMRDGNYSLVADPDFELSTDNMFDEAWIPAIKTGSYTNYQLFDLSKDPNQETNIATENPELLKKLKKKLLNINASIMADGPDWHLQ
ncbi:sulfatase-like hydrolase/transferase [Opitutales bacterium]|nr:sulfatase-like hydrolase/transferase [Opitutales bacterium]